MRTGDEAFRVAVAGAGLGGLCLAQYLAAGGVDVTVYECDASLDARAQGYRVHLDARAGRALAEALPEPLYALFARTCGQPSSAVTVLDERLRLLHREPAAPPSDTAADPYAPDTLSTAADRRVLRQILAHGLGERIRFGHRVTGFEQDPNGVRIDLADGGTERAAVLVAADGIGSPVRRAYLPAARLVDGGSRCVYGRTPVPRPPATDPPGPLAPLGAGFTAVIGDRVGMALAPMRFRTAPDQAAVPGLDITLAPVGDYLMWALTARRERWGVAEEDFDGLPPDRLHGVAVAMTRRWHQDLRAVVEQAAVSDCFPARIRHSTPIPAWQPSRVTVLGDAIHAMSPARGSGANAALRDAAELGRRLLAVARGEAELTAAIGGYESAMREYGYRALRASARAERDTAARRPGLARRLFHRHVPGR